VTRYREAGIREYGPCDRSVVEIRMTSQASVRAHDSYQTCLIFSREFASTMSIPDRVITLRERETVLCVELYADEPVLYDASMENYRDRRENGSGDYVVLISYLESTS
jgi:hypothetical protein